VTYDLPSRIGDFNVSLLQNFDSGAARSVVGSVDTRPYVTNPGYLNPPAAIDYFIGGRGSMRTDDITSTNLAVNYSYRFRDVEIFVQPEILNVFNEQGVDAFNDEVLTAVDCPAPAAGSPNLAAPCPERGLQRFNPFTEQPVQGTHYIFGPSFGRPTVESSYQTARTFRVSLGVRF
jgi:hypothetical protein